MREERGSREGREREGGKGGREGARKQKVSLLLVVLWHFSLSYFRDSVLRLCRTFWGIEGIPGCGIFLSFIL